MPIVAHAEAAARTLCTPLASSKGWQDQIERPDAFDRLPRALLATHDFNRRKFESLGRGLGIEVRMLEDRSEAGWEWAAGAVLWLFFQLLDFGSQLESWRMVALALALPVAFSLVRLLAADPRSD